MENGEKMGGKVNEGSIEERTVWENVGILEVRGERVGGEVLVLCTIPLTLGVQNLNFSGYIVQVHVTMHPYISIKKKKKNTMHPYIAETSPSHLF